MSDEITMPSQVDAHVSIFDRFAERAARFVSRPVFFTFCVLMVIVWAPSIVFIHDIDLWQLIINTATTIITFLMVALLENANSRTNVATQHKLNAIAKAQADTMRFLAENASPSYKPEIMEDVRELEAAVGLEQRESS